MKRADHSKYHAKKTKVDNITFDSKKEAKRYVFLKEQEQTGQIKNLQRQVKYELIPSQKDKDTGKVIERAVVYKADFVYELDGEQIVEDVKGVRTPEYVIKRKLLMYKYGIRLKEV
jgi:hypothetical protein